MASCSAHREHSRRTALDGHDDIEPKSNRTSADFTRCGFANRSIDSPNTSPTTRYVWSQFWGGTVARLFLAGDVQLTRCQRVGIAAWRCTIRSKYSRHRDVWIPQSSIRAVNGLNYLGSAHLPVGEWYPTPVPPLRLVRLGPVSLHVLLLLLLLLMYWLKWRLTKDAAGALYRVSGRR